MVAFAVSVALLVGGIGLCIAVGRRRPPGAPFTWGEALVAATFVFGLMLLGYGIVPNQWLKWADNELLWRPDGKVTRTVSIHSGRFSGTRFCQITSPPTPSGWRLSWHGRSYNARTIPSPTLMKYRTRSSFVSPRAGK